MPDAEVQRLVDRLVHAPSRNLDYYADVLALRALAYPRHPRYREAERHVILQAAHYAAHRERPPIERGPAGEEIDIIEGADPRQALNHVRGQLGIPTTTVVAALIPYLDGGDRVREFILEEVLLDETPTFELEKNDELVQALTSYIGEHKKDPPWRMVQLLYWKAPSAAVFDMHAYYNTGDVEKLRAAEWANHVVKDVLWKRGRNLLEPGEWDKAIAALDNISKYPDWWVKLYVAEMLRRHEGLRDPQILRRLRGDENPLVAKAADVPFHHGRPEEQRRR